VKSLIDHTIQHLFEIVLKCSVFQSILFFSEVVWTLKMTFGQVLETSVTNNSSFQNYSHRKITLYEPLKLFLLNCMLCSLYGPTELIQITLITLALLLLQLRLWADLLARLRQLLSTLSDARLSLPQFCHLTAKSPSLYAKDSLFVPSIF